jgi:hypothetical protein
VFVSLQIEEAREFDEFKERSIQEARPTGEEAFMAAGSEGVGAATTIRPADEC